MKSYLFFALILITSGAHAERYFAYMGGSGDPPGEKTLFDMDISPVANYAKESHSNTEVAFNGGHSKTETLLKQEFAGTPVSDFTQASYEALITRYENDIKSGKIKSGDQLLVMIDTHGAKGYPGTTTHPISTGRGTAVDLNDLKGSETVSLDRMLNLTKLAEQNGIKLGIIDLSCHSGASIPLGNSKTCVITASGPNSFAYGGGSQSIFSGRVLARMVPGKNLESLFLDARERSNDLGFPMISTSEGKNIQNQLYPLLQKYINYRDRGADKFSDEILNTVKNQTCQQENTEYEKLMNLTREIESVTSGLSLERLRKALTDYHDYRRTIQDAYQKAGVNRLKEEKNVCAISPAKIRCEPLSIEYILTAEPDVRIDENELKLKNAKSENEKVEYREWISYFKNMKKAKAEILKANPGLANYSKVLSNFPSIELRTYRLAEDVSNESRKAYSALYRPSPASNPCRDFVL